MITKYKIFEEISESSADIKNTCKEILLELSDVGFDISVNLGFDNDLDKDIPDMISIKLSRNKIFQAIDIQDYLLRISDYLKQYDLVIDRNAYTCPSLTDINILSNHITYSIYDVCFNIETWFFKNKSSKFKLIKYESPNKI